MYGNSSRLRAVLFVLQVKGKCMKGDCIACDRMGDDYCKKKS